MRGRLRIIIGAGVAVLLGWALHGPLGQGEAFMADLRLRSITALAAHEPGDVRISYPAAPYVRTAHLSGAAGPALRAEALGIVSGVKGNSGAIWDEAAAGDAGRAAPVQGAVAPSGSQDAVPTAPQVAQAGPAAGAPVAPLSAMSCQRGVDAALAGRAVQFRDGSAWLSPASRRIIANVAAALRDCGGHVLEVGGHGNGEGLANRAMADERARRVRAVLIEAGVPADAVTARGYGAARPLHAGRPADPANQRVSFTIMAGGV